MKIPFQFRALGGLARAGCCVALLLAGPPSATAASTTTITIAEGSFGQEQLDPAREAGSTVRQMQLLMYDTLLEIGEKSEVVPGLVTEWSQGSDGITWSFKLRQGVHFHGEYGELTAEDVKFSIERWMDLKGSHPELGLVRSMIDTVNVVDPYTFQIITKGPQPTLPYLLSPHQSVVGIVWSKKHLSEKGGADFEAQSKALNEHPIGSGPYQFVSRARGQNLIFQAVPNHWRVQPHVQRVEYLLIPDASTRIAMLRAGEIDITSIDADRTAEVSATTDVEVRSVPEAISYAVMFNGTWRKPAENKPTSKAAVRRALSLAIDRKSILAALYEGRGNIPSTPFPTTSETDGIDQAHFTAWAEEIATYDPERARKLLADAGYPDGFDGVKLFMFSRSGGLQNSPQILLAIAAQWAEIGVKVEPVAVDYATFRPHFVKAAADDPYNAGDAHGFDIAPWFTSQVVMQTYFSHASNIAQLTDSAALDDLLSTVNAVLDPKARAEQWNRIWEIANESWTVLPIMNVDALFGVSKEVGTWTPRPGWPYMGRMIESIKQ